MNAAPHVGWAEANQHYLVTEFARLKAQLAGEEASAPAEHRQEARAMLPQPAAIDQLVGVFGLSRFERDLLLLCAGVEMDADLAAHCAAAQGSPHRPFATFGLALGALAEPHWNALTPVRPLRRWRLVELKDESALNSGRLKIDERVLHYLAGVNYLDARLQLLLRSQHRVEVMADGHVQVVQAVLRALEVREDAIPAVQLAGEDPSGQQEVAAAVAHELGLQLHVLRAADIPAGLHEQDALAVLWQREAALLGGALLIEGGSEGTGAGHGARLAEQIGGPAVCQDSSRIRPRSRL
jgi:hypothetical protein